MGEQQKERETRERIEAQVRAAREAQDCEDQEQIRQVEEQREADARAEAEALAQAEAAADAEASLKRKQFEEEEAHRCQEEKDANARRLAEEQRRFAAQETDMKGKLDKLLKEYGVGEVNQKKKSLMSSRYPIHHAVEKGDAEAVRVLLHFKADASSLNSSKKTALQLAEKSKTKDEAIISMLKAA